MSKSKLAYNYISAVLKWGSYLSLLILLVGLMLFALSSSAFPGISQIKALSLSQLANGLSKFKPIALVNLGLLILMLTPILRVMVAIFSFVLEKDLRYTLVAIAVLIILIFSLLVAA
jgi:uncharacterized membrane protein